LKARERKQKEVKRGRDEVERRRGRRRGKKTRSLLTQFLLLEEKGFEEQNKKTRHHAPDRVYQDARDPQRCDDRGQGAQGPRQGPARYVSGGERRSKRKGCLSERAERQRRRRPDRPPRGRERTRPALAGFALSRRVSVLCLFELRFGTISAARGDGRSLLFGADAGSHRQIKMIKSRRQRRPIIKGQKDEKSHLFLPTTNTPNRHADARFQAPGGRHVPCRGGGEEGKGVLMTQARNDGDNGGDDGCDRPPLGVRRESSNRQEKRKQQSPVRASARALCFSSNPSKGSETPSRTKGSVGKGELCSRRALPTALLSSSS
jgi:hypothetical protein